MRTIEEVKARIEGDFRVLGFVLNATADNTVAALWGQLKDLLKFIENKEITTGE